MNLGAAVARSSRAVRIGMHYAAEAARLAVWDPLNHLFGPPVIGQLAGDSTVHTDPASFICELFPDADVAALAAEHADVRAAAERRRREVDLPYGDVFAVEEGTAFCLYAMVRLQRPEHVLETGVADGYSSSTVLAAMDRNGVGTLHSTDIRANSGVLVGEHPRWDRHILDRGAPARSFTAFVAALPPLDFFVHDSLHRRAWQLRELRLAYGKLRPGGLLASDDAESSFGWVDFARSHGLRQVLLFDRRKIFAAARTPAR